MFKSKEDEGFLAKLPTFEKRCETPAGTFETSAQEEPPPRLTQINQPDRPDTAERQLDLLALPCLNSFHVFVVVQASAPNMWTE